MLRSLATCRLLSTSINQPCKFFSTIVNTSKDLFKIKYKPLEIGTFKSNEYELLGINDLYKSYHFSGHPHKYHNILVQKVQFENDEKFKVISPSFCLDK